MAKLEIKSKVSRVPRREMAGRKRGGDRCITVVDPLTVFVQFDAEFRRISLPKTDVVTYEHFRTLIERLHKLIEVPFVLSYTDPKDGDLLPINNDDNLGRAVLTAKPLLRIIIQRKGKGGVYNRTVADGRTYRVYGQEPRPMISCCR